MQAILSSESTAVRSASSPRSLLSLVARHEASRAGAGLTYADPSPAVPVAAEAPISRPRARFGSVEVIPFERHHARLIVPQPAQEAEAALQVEAPDGPAWTAVVDGLPVACAGFVPVWVGRAYAWALLGADVGPHLLAVTRAIRCRLACSGFRRVEMAVDCEFANGRQWARMLGFECEGLARAYLPNGRDAWIYARVN